VIETGAGVPVDVSEGIGADVGNCEYRCRYECGWVRVSVWYECGWARVWSGENRRMGASFDNYDYIPTLSSPTIIPTPSHSHTILHTHTHALTPTHPPTPAPTSNSYSQRKPNTYSEQ
jgi:hypothetical protein